jgi:YHS domain-containing protein
MKTKPVMLIAIACLTASLEIGCTNQQKSDSGTSQSAPQSSSTSTDKASSGANLIYKDDRGIAINGTDLVAYFQEQRPVPGKPEFSHTWMNATWHFANAANRDLFAANPERYAPQYGGYCAYAVASGYVAPSVPEAWSIVDGKLYLNFSTGVRNRWERDTPGNIAKANQNWPAAASNPK